VLVTAPGVEPTVRTGARLGARAERDLQTLLADQSAGLGDAESSVARVTWAWTTARRTLADASRNLDEAVERAQQAHVRVPVTVRQTSGSVQAATSRASHDPLDVDPEHVQAVLAEVGTRIEELSGALRERAAFDDRLATTTGDLDDASRLVTDLRSRWRDVRRRVAVESCSDDRLDELDHRLSGLRGQVAGLAEVANVDWAATGRRLTHVQDAIRSVRQDAMTTDAQLTAALAERDVLRGRLSAYQARAARSHRAEDPDLDVRFEAAYETLHRAPVDLIRAAALVHAYVACLEQVEVRP
jgi:chromosome segregation ATPase